jgi:hypothetical protein
MLSLPTLCILFLTNGLAYDTGWLPNSCYAVVSDNDVYYIDTVAASANNSHSNTQNSTFWFQSLQGLKSQSLMLPKPNLPNDSRFPSLGEYGREYIIWRIKNGHLYRYHTLEPRDNFGITLYSRNLRSLSKESISSLRDTLDHKKPPVQLLANYMLGRQRLAAGPDDKHMTKVAPHVAENQGFWKARCLHSFTVKDGEEVTWMSLCDTTNQPGFRQQVLHSWKIVDNKREQSCAYENNSEHFVGCDMHSYVINIDTNVMMINTRGEYFSDTIPARGSVSFQMAREPIRFIVEDQDHNKFYFLTQNYYYAFPEFKKPLPHKLPVGEFLFLQQTLPKDRPLGEVAVVLAAKFARFVRGIPEPKE